MTTARRPHHRGSPKSPRTLAAKRPAATATAGAPRADTTRDDIQASQPDGPAATRKVIVLSGGSGRTGRQVLRAALAQFPSPEVEVISHARIRSVRSAERIVRRAAKERALVIHTLVAPQVRQVVIREAERHMVPLVDVLGPVLTALRDHLGTEPRNKAGLSYELEKEYFDRIDSVDFTLAHDDGRRADELSLADVVLVGVSRVSKSVTCFYLANWGIRAANVPIIPDQPLPEELESIDPRRVVGLSMNPARLLSLRQARLESDGLRQAVAYVDADSVRRELNEARRLIQQHRWRIIDVSYMAVEEVAQEIVAQLELLEPLEWTTPG